MTTPSQPDFSAGSAAGSRLIGLNDLQNVVDRLSSAVDKLASVAQSIASPGLSGTTTASFRNTGQTFTYGSFPRMASAAASFAGGGGAQYATQPGGMGGGAMNNPAGTLQSAGQQMGQTAQAAIYPSGAKFSNQITMNQYASMSMLGAGPGVSLKQGFSAMYRQAFGNYNSNLNAIANNPADAAQMYSNLQGIAASPFVMSTALGRAGFGAAAGFGVANPTLGGAASAQAAAQLYSGQTSMLMRMYGYGASPRAGMGQQNPLSMAQTVQTMLQRWYGSGSVSQGTLNAGLANNGRLRLNLQALGLDVNTMGPALQMYNKLFSQGLNAQQAQTLLNDAAHNQNYQGQSAQKILSNRYGIPTSDLQKLKDTTAVQTGTTSGEMSGFDAAISQATTTVQKFDMVLNTILKTTGLGTVIGASHGFSGAMNSVGGFVGSMFNKGMGMITGLLGGAGGPGTAGSTSAGTGRGTPGSSSNTSMSRAVATAIKDAESQLGRPYVWGGNNPAVGFDCSGLVEWAYGQAGIRLPRTSQEQWAALKNRSVPIGKVQAGDILFSAGSDGSPNNPGHEALAISSKQIIEAPYTGANIRIRALDPGEWAHAARPSGSLTSSGGGGGTSGNNGNSSPSSTTGKGNGGLGLYVGNYGSSDELANVQSALLGGIPTGGGAAGGGTFGSSSVGNGQGSGTKSNTNVSTAGGGSPAANRALGQKLAKQMYGWVGAEWNALDKLWGTYESGWRNTAQNPGSTAYGIAQFLDSTWKPYGKKTSNPGLQIKYGLEYVHDRYRDPIRALQFELSHTPHWYGEGTRNALPGFALLGERGPELVKLGGGQQVMNASQTADILKGSHAKPGQTPWDSHTARELVLAATAQNSGHRATGKCEVNLHMPAGAIVIHTNGSPSDVSANVRQIMQGVSEAMAENEMVQKIMQGVMG
jgi:cell wall-associated NlpC family hydrolase